ncbi:MAG: ATP synthase F1 subunit gamma [Planctomycetes bacterium]|nr:ATP synthase F1 subunit gamma [Planctomycetota bacterium]
MASIRELRSRIKSVGSIRQITRAMEMVATTKLRRFQERAVASRPYSQEISGMVTRLASMLGDDVGDRPLFKKGAGERTLILLVTSDRGLCGAYNSNVFKVLETWLLEHPGKPVDTFVYGRKGYQYLTRRGRQVERFLVEPPLEQTDYRAAARAARELTNAFLSGKYSEVVVLYTAFESVVRYVPKVVPFLPIEAAAVQAGGAKAGDPKASGPGASGDVLLEPDAGTLFDRLVPRYLETRIYNALLESLTSEYASRRVSMKNATDAAKTMQNALKRVYNRKRQENITKELLDIVGGSEALR